MQLRLIRGRLIAKQTVFIQTQRVKPPREPQQQQ
jgi:hypothetical protein